MGYWKKTFKIEKKIFLICVKNHIHNKNIFFFFFKQENYFFLKPKKNSFKIIFKTAIKSKFLALNQIFI